MKEGETARSLRSLCVPPSTPTWWLGTAQPSRLTRVAFDRDNEVVTQPEWIAKW